ncbi:hypothetical protein GPECTOR_11g296 [Gonium pectorale]|uniref:Nucleotide exchange factor Fes1 domain-containing protein n=1 Tax=Gonium pectorale TaxID=33097 RepID=A0A150GQ41_GONPE|nr:hypothetical protein GPECTOR_11g296 [Gonium pectorale]|eukprot:KXZ51858.1 hypothetical protein GPECTOR_11g296 [Gonium pectorale]
MRDLHKIGGLPVLLELLDSPHPSLRWRAAEVVATCVANNPPVQQWFLEGGVLPRLLALAEPEQPPTVRAKAVLALSGLVRHFAPGLQALRDAGGIRSLVSAASSSDRRLARRAMTTLSYALGQRRADCAVAADAGALPPLLAALGLSPAPSSSSMAAETTLGEAGAAPEADAAAAAAAEEDGQLASEFRQAALGVLLQLAGHPDTWAAVRDAPRLVDRLAALQANHGSLPAEDREAREEEASALAALAAALAAAAPPALRPDEVDHVSAADFEAAGPGVSGFAVHQQQQQPVAATAARRGAGDAGAGAGDQGAAGGVTAPGGQVGAEGQGQGGGQGGAAGGAVAAPPLLLGPPS